MASGKKGSMTEWAKTLGLRKSPQNRPCIWRLIGKKFNHGKYHSCIPHGMGLDHCSLWLKNGKPEVFISQPYQLFMGELERLSKFCRENNIKYVLRVRPGYLPEPMLTIEITRNEEH